MVKRHFGLPNNFLELITSSYTRTVNFSSPLPGNKRLRGTVIHITSQFIYKILVNHLLRPHIQSPLLQSRFQPRNHNPQPSHKPNPLPPPLQSQTVHLLPITRSLQRFQFHPIVLHSALAPPSPRPPIRSPKIQKQTHNFRQKNK